MLTLRAKLQQATTATNAPNRYWRLLYGIRTPYAITSHQERSLKLTFEASSVSLTTLSFLCEPCIPQCCADALSEATVSHHCYQGTGSVLEATVLTPYTTTSHQERSLKLTLEASSMSLTTPSAPL